MNRLILGTLLLVAACSDDASSIDSPANCQPAVSRYYAAGCSYQSGEATLSESDAIGACEAAVGNLASQCLQLSVEFFACSNGSGCGCQSDFDALNSSCNLAVAAGFNAR